MWHCGLASKNLTYIAGRRRGHETRRRFALAWLSDGIAQRLDRIVVEASRLCYSKDPRSETVRNCCKSSGRSAAWLARLVRAHEVERSDPFAPTPFQNQLLAPPLFPYT